MPGNEAKNPDADFIHIRQENPKQYDRYTTQTFGKGIKARLGWNGNKSEAQVIMFDKKNWTVSEAKAWIKSHPEYHLSENAEIKEGKDDVEMLSENHFYLTQTVVSSDASWFWASKEHDKDQNGIELTEKMFDDWVKNFKANVLKHADTDGKPTLDIDYEHKTDPKYGMDAAGWIADVAKKILFENGKRIATFWIKPKQWTPTAQEVIDTRAKIFFSPEYKLKYKDLETGKIYDNVLFGGGLTNRPYIHGLAPVMLSTESVEKLVEKDEHKKKEGAKPMLEKIKALLAQHSITLSENATDEYVVDKTVDHIKYLSEKADEAVKLAETVKTLEADKKTLSEKVDALEVVALSEKKAAAEKSLECKVTPAELKDEKNPVAKMLKEKRYDDVIALSAMLPKKLKDTEHEEPDGDEDGEDGKADGGKEMKTWDELAPDEQVKKTEKHMEKHGLKEYSKAAVEAKMAHNEKAMKAKEKLKEKGVK